MLIFKQVQGSNAMDSIDGLDEAHGKRNEIEEEN